MFIPSGFQRELELLGLGFIHSVLAQVMSPGTRENLDPRKYWKFPSRYFLQNGREGGGKRREKRNLSLRVPGW